MTLRMASATTIILRIEGCNKQPNDQLEQVADPDLGIWVKDIDILPYQQDDVIEYLKEIVILASKIDHGNKYIHINLAESVGSFRLSPHILKSISDADCILEIEL